MILVKYSFIRLHKKYDGGAVNYNNFTNILCELGYESDPLFVSYKGIRSYLKVIAFCIKNRKNTFIFNQSFICFLAYPFFWFFGTNFILILDSIDNNYPGLGLVNNAKSKLIFLINSYMIRRASLVIVETEFLKNKLNEKFKFDASFVLKTPYPDVTAYSSDRKNEKIKLLYVGRLSHEKGIVNLVDFCNRINADKFQVSVVGDGNMKSYLLDNSGNAIEFHGWLGKEDLSKLYKESDILIHFPISDAYPTTLREAMSYGVPVISLDIQGIPEIVSSGCNGELLDYYDFDLVIKEIYKIIGSYEFYKKNAYCKARNNDYISYKMKIDELINQLL